MNERQEGAKVPNRRLMELLELLLYHHKAVRKPDAFGVKLYQDALEAYLLEGKLPVGKAGYLLNRLHPKGRWSSYYSKVHIDGAKTKQEHPLVLYFKQRPEELILATEGFGFGMKDEVKLFTFGSIENFDAWVYDVVSNEQVSLMSKLMNKMTSDEPLKKLPAPIKKVLLKAIGFYLMKIGPKLDGDDFILLRSLLKKHGLTDTFGVF